MLYKKLAAKPSNSRQNQKAHSKTKMFMAKQERVDQWEAICAEVVEGNPWKSYSTIIFFKLLPDSVRWLNFPNKKADSFLFMLTNETK